MGFQYAGNLGGAGAPVVREMIVSETMYVGQMAQGGEIAAIGDCEPLDAPTDLNHGSFRPVGCVLGVVDDGRTYTTPSSGTAQYGDTAVYSATQSVIANTGPATVKVALNVPGVTMFKASLYNGTWGTVLTEHVIGTTNSAGTSVIVTSATTDYGDDTGTCYCRTGANRGIYRRISTITTTTSTIVIPFPYTITAGDTFVFCGPTLGFCNIMTEASADFVNANDVQDDGYAVYCHELNLQESGKEYMVFAFWGGDNTSPA
jgi:hypothetical protein